MSFVLSSRPRRLLLCHAIGLALILPPPASVARDMFEDEHVTISSTFPLEAWTVPSRAVLTLLTQTVTLNVSLWESTLIATDATIRSTAPGTADVALSVTNGANAQVQGGLIHSDAGTGLVVAGRPGVAGADKPAEATITGTVVFGGNIGATISNGSTLSANGAHIQGMGEDGSGVGTGIGVNIGSGTARLLAGSYVSGTKHGVVLVGDSRGNAVPSPGRFLVVDDSVVEGHGGAAVAVKYVVPGDATASISVVNGGRLVGSNGHAVEVADRMHADIDIATSTVEGDIVAFGSATAGLTLGAGGVLRGVVSGGAIDAGIDTTGTWVATADAAVASLRLDGALAFDPDGGRKKVDVSGDFTGRGGSLTLNTALNAGGPLDTQSTDRLLIHGDVATTGTTLVSVVPTGEGALTDINRNGAVDASEGISIIQVGGASRADAFALMGTYVAAGPYQYTLHAFGPGATDAAQNVLPAGTPLNWDYRLGNRYVSDCGDDCDPVTPPVDPTDPVHPVDPVNPVDPPPSPDPVDRPAVVPQLPSYLVAPMALQNYGNLLNDGLHQRLGEIRESTYGASVGGEVFARYLGSQQTYQRNLSFQRFGYDFDQQINALQVGGGLVDVDNDAGSLRGGWALDSGTTRVTPSAADGRSRAKYNANGGSAWITWQHGASALWVDGVIGVTRYHGDVSTDLRGDEVARLRAQGWTMSVETGMPLPLGGDWTIEPQFQLRVQRLDFSDFRDKDGLDLRIGASTQVTSRLSAQVARVANRKFSPYGRFDLIHTAGGSPSLSASSASWNTGDAFDTGRTGNSVRVAAGLTSQLTDHVQLYGEGTWQRRVGGYGLAGWAANAGVRVTF